MHEIVRFFLVFLQKFGLKGHMADETVNYTGDNIKTLEWNEHIRKRAGMYIGRLGNGDNPGDGIYVLLKEVIDNSIDEFTMGYGKAINITQTTAGHAMCYKLFYD